MGAVRCSVVGHGVLRVREPWSRTKASLPRARTAPASVKLRMLVMDASKPRRVRTVWPGMFGACCWPHVSGEMVERCRIGVRDSAARACLFVAVSYGLHLLVYPDADGPPLPSSSAVAMELAVTPESAASKRSREFDLLDAASVLGTWASSRETSRVNSPSTSRPASPSAVGGHGESPSSLGPRRPQEHTPAATTIGLAHGAGEGVCLWNTVCGACLASGSLAS